MFPTTDETNLFLKSMHLFHNLDIEEMEEVVKAFKIHTVGSGPIFNQEEDAQYFYIILTGKVSVTLTLDEQVETLAVLERGDYFGQDALLVARNYRTSAVALEPCTLLRINDEAFEQLAGSMPGLVPPLKQIWETYQLLLHTHQPWREPEETIYYYARKHRFFLYGRLALPILAFVLLEIPLALVSVLLYPGWLMYTLTILLALFLIGLGLWNAVDWANDYYIVTRDRVVYLERVVLLYDSRQETPLDAILSVAVNTSQLGRILGYGNVTVSTYTGDLVMRRLASPEELVVLINEKRAKARDNSYRSQRSSIRATLQQRLGYVKPGEKKPIPAEVESGPVSRTLSDLFKMRYEVNGEITYRTHWFILIVRTFLPGALMALMFLLTLLSLSGKLPYPPASWLAALEIPLFLWWLYRYLDWANDKYVIGKDMLLDLYKKPLGREERRTAPFKNIQSIDYTRRNLIGLIFNFGTVSIRVGDDILTFDNVYNPAEVQREIFERFMQTRLAEKNKDEEQDRQRIAEWIEIYNEVQQDQQHRQHPPF